MRQKWWVRFIVVLAAVQAVRMVASKFQQLGGSAATTQPVDTITLDPYLPLRNVTAKPKTWEEPLFTPKQRRSLNFLHIPKTGGTSIVVAAANASYAWSDCMFPLRRETKNCPTGTPVNNNTTLHSSETAAKTTRRGS